ncbi:MAG: RIP metalloprotease RseP [Nitrospirae bacterium]|nr:RIP metalloprotease RseP [Nitrospirota bacterium]
MPQLTPQAIIAFIAVLAFLIFIHELGHFLVARACRVKVLTFAIGFGPTVFSRTRGATEYALKAIPLGGYVKMFGEEVDTEMSAGDRSQSFAGKSVWQRMAIVFAGPLFNLLGALVIFCAVFAWGVPVMDSRIGAVVADSPATVAGIRAEDVVVSLAGQPIREWEQIRARVQEVGGTTVEVGVERDGVVRNLAITPVRTTAKNIFGESVDTWQIGIGPKGTTFVQRHNPVDAVVLGAQRTYEVTELTVLGIVKLIQRVIPSDTIGGPILIAQITGQQANEGLLNVLLFVALLSVNLGVLNLLPIPVLDGGHLVFLAAEALLGRPVSVRVREVAQQAGLFALLALMAFAFYNDIMRLFTGG